MFGFTKSHEWVKVEGDIALVGITEYAQKELGDIVFVELLKIGEEVKQFSQFGTIESTKAASEMYAPLSGKVFEVNNDLINSPQWVNDDPLGKGWMIKIQLADSKEIGNLLDEKSYEELIEKASR